MIGDIVLGVVLLICATAAGIAIADNWEIRRKK